MKDSKSSTLVDYLRSPGGSARQAVGEPLSSARASTTPCVRENLLVNGWLGKVDTARQEPVHDLRSWKGRMRQPPAPAGLLHAQQPGAREPVMG